jgi:type II secretory pathway pseudopilin PulG
MRKRRLRRGFTFAETLLSVFIVASAATIVGATMPVATMSKTKAAYRSLAANYAQKQIEQMKMLGYQNLNATRLASAGLIDSANPTSGTTYSMANVDSAFNGQIGSILPNGTASMTLTQDANELRRIVIRVNWNERGAVRTYTVGTLVANL